MGIHKIHAYMQAEKNMAEISEKLQEKSELEFKGRLCSACQTIHMSKEYHCVLEYMQKRTCLEYRVLGGASGTPRYYGE